MKCFDKEEDCWLQKGGRFPGIFNRRWMRGNANTRGKSNVHAFTMIEIAISLAVIGFALVAIVGVLPMGMGVQKENREETIINEDATMWMEALRSGAHGMDDLTNYVTAITNYSTIYSSSGGGRPQTDTFGYSVNGSTFSPRFPLTSGERIVGLLSTPKYVPFVRGKDVGFRSNYIVAYVRSMSGDASDKFPQTNQSLRELAFSYRMIAEIIPFNGYDNSWVSYGDPAIKNNTNEIAARSNYWMYAKNLQTNLHDIRLIFRWPLLPNGNTGNGRQVYRTMASGALMPTNAFGFPVKPEYSLFFFQPSTYVKAP